MCKLNMVFGFFLNKFFLSISLVLFFLLLGVFFLVGWKINRILFVSWFLIFIKDLVVVIKIVIWLLWL